MTGSAIFVCFVFFVVILARLGPHPRQFASFAGHPPWLRSPSDWGRLKEVPSTKSQVPREEIPNAKSQITKPQAGGFGSYLRPSAVSTDRSFRPGRIRKPTRPYSAVLGPIRVPPCASVVTKGYQVRVAGAPRYVSARLGSIRVHLRPSAVSRDRWFERYVLLSR